MRIITWNINGWKATQSKPFFKQLIMDYNPDILCLQEIKINKKDVVEFDGYQCEYHTGEKQGYSGTAIFYKPAIKPIKVKRNKTEGRLISMELDDFVLVNVYVPNSGEGLKRLHPSPNIALSRLEWDKKFITALKNLQKTSSTDEKPLIVVGDMNVARTKHDIKNARTNTKNAGFTIEERESFEEILKSVQLRDIWRELHPTKEQYTYWSYLRSARKTNAGWRIDYALLSDAVKAVDCQILDHVLGSDHAPVMLDI